MSGLTRTKHRLLRTIDGKPHASSDDHAETADTCISDANPAGMMEEDIFAEPMSSDDEIAIVTSQPAPQIELESSSPAPPPKQKTQPLVAAASQQKRRTARPAKPRPPRNGQFESGKREKEKVGRPAGAEEEKENTWVVGSSQSSGTSAKRDAGEFEPIEMFDPYAYGGPKRQKAGYGASTTTNIHAGPPKPRTFAKTKTFGAHKAGYRSSVSERMTRGEDDRKSREKPRKKKDDDSDLSDSEIEMVPLPGELPRPPKRRPYPSSKELYTSHTNLDDLATYRDEPTPSTSDSSKPPNLNLTSSRPSTPLSSTPLSPIASHPSKDPQAPLENASDLQHYPNSLSASTPDDKCPLCETPVSQSLYWSWWKGKKMSVHQRSLFCHEHRKRTAQAEYTKRGYPSIDWAALPQRIETHHPRLIDVLRNETGSRKSTFREAHRQRMLAGDRTTVRALLQRDELLESKTGYYGPRGRRAFMEIITLQLADVIREAVERDEVVSWGGMASFVQSVLVPEVAVQLVMQDLGVGERVAVEVLRESREVGALVNEEVEERVEWGGEGDGDEWAEREEEDEVEVVEVD